MPGLEQVRDYLGLSRAESTRRPSLLAFLTVVVGAVAVGYVLTEVLSLPGVFGLIATVVVVLGGLWAWQALGEEADSDRPPAGSGTSLPG